MAGDRGTSFRRMIPRHLRRSPRPRPASVDGFDHGHPPPIRRVSGRDITPPVERLVTVSSQAVLHASDGEMRDAHG